MTQPYSGFQVAGAVEPLSTTTSDTLLKTSDPCLYYSLDFFSYVINTDPGPALIKAMAGNIPSGPRQTMPPTSAVMQRYPYLPQSEFLDNQFHFPLLCIGRKESKYRWRRAAWEDDRTTFDLLYVLPPLNAAQSERVLPILRSVERTIRHKTTQSFDPGYTPPGGTAGQSPWGLAFAAVEEIGFETGNYGFLEGTGSLLFPTLRMSGYFIERDMYNAAAMGAKPLAGADLTVNMVAPDGSSLAFASLATQNAPSITSLSVVTGPAAGGTATTITGKFFLDGPPVVLFGSSLAPSVVRVSATSITCVTPAISGPGVLGVTVVNRDGQSASLPAAFTFV